MIDDILYEINKLSVKEDYSRTNIPYLTICKSNKNIIYMPKLKNTYIYFIIKGEIQFYSINSIIEYKAGDFFISQITTPNFALNKSKEFTAVIIDITADDLMHVILNLDNNSLKQIINHKFDINLAITSEKYIMSALHRMLLFMNNYQHYNTFLINNIKYEIIYHILLTSKGYLFLKNILQIQHSEKIYEINNFIKENFYSKLNVSHLAEKCNMSISLFHQKFKNIVGMSPIQCQKQLRLTESRKIILTGNNNITDAALETGYESISQFIRDYKKFFGITPKQDIIQYKKILKE